MHSVFVSTLPLLLDKIMTPARTPQCWLNSPARRSLTDQALSSRGVGVKFCFSLTCVLGPPVAVLATIICCLLVLPFCELWEYLQMEPSSYTLWCPDSSFRGIYNRVYLRQSVADYMPLLKVFFFLKKNNWFYKIRSFSSFCRLRLSLESSFSEIFFPIYLFHILSFPLIISS